ncbi:helix-turn-helix domain-containing protein [Streptomyces griseorubiginosus]|uniref:helix-turn-helix domain-containing protein n=1 Tax=Streptomyces griseorubiginosus TaxID=67304 RepID=UPI0036E9E916
MDAYASSLPTQQTTEGGPFIMTSTPGRPWGPLRGGTEEANQLARFLRNALNQSNLTLREISDRLMYSRSTVSEYMSGRKVPPWQAVEQLTLITHRDSDPRLQERKVSDARHLWNLAQESVSREKRIRQLTPTPPASRDTQVETLQRRLIETQQELIEANSKLLTAQNTISMLLRLLASIQNSTKAWF